MEQTITFKNIEHTINHIAADLFLENKFIVRLAVNNMEHLVNSANTNIGLYEYFRKAMLECIDRFGAYKSDSKEIH